MQVENRSRRLLQALLLPGLMAGIVAGCSSDDDGNSDYQDSLQVDLKPVAEGFTTPIAMEPVPRGGGRFLVVDQIGLIHVLKADGTVREDPFFDIRNRMVELDPEYDERGLLGLALHPDFDLNGKFYVYYSAPLEERAPGNYDNTSRLSEFQADQSGDWKADPELERILLEVHQPQSNHAAGQLASGPDGYLYVALGDGGGAGDTGMGHVEDWYRDSRGGNGQDITQNLLGSILRLDVKMMTAFTGFWS